MQQWKTQERITLNLNRITFGNVTACNLDCAVKGFIPLEKCEGREKLLMLMDFWKLQGLRKLCPLSLLSYALLSITLAIKIHPPLHPLSVLSSLTLSSQPTLWLLHLSIWLLYFLSCFVLSPRPRLAHFWAFARECVLFHFHLLRSRHTCCDLGLESFLLIVSKVQPGCQSVEGGTCVPSWRWCSL